MFLVAFVAAIGGVVTNLVAMVSILRANPRISLAAFFVVTSIICVMLGIWRQCADVGRSSMFQICMVGVISGIVSVIVVLGLYAAIQGNSRTNAANRDQMSELIENYLDAFEATDSVEVPDAHADDQKIPN
jgi:hypothetical protein